MPDESLKAYLAQKYMTGPKADAILARASTSAGKRKKRKQQTDPGTSASGSAIIVDDDARWVAPGGNEEEDITEAVVEKDRSFKKRKVDGNGKAQETGWTTVREGLVSGKPPPEPEPEDEKPQIVDDKPFVGGLITSSSQKVPSSSSFDMHKNNKPEDVEAQRIAQETVYRDASGRRIDTKAERAAAARLKREREEREARKMQWGKGLVQRDEEERKKQQLEKEKKRDLAVYADDKELNAELKEKERWNDPAAAFLSKKSKKGPRKPEYQGPPPPPNRFGIKPGYRWDGVDRSNGFERKLFQKQNERRRKGTESYEWSVDDM